MVHARTSDEGGSALVMALVVLTVVGVVVAAALPFAGTSLRSSNTALGPHRDALYAADAAMQSAIEWVSTHPDAASGLGDADCADHGVTFGYDDPVVGPVPVEVCPQGDSFAPLGRPRSVLLALGDDADDGIEIDGGGAIYVRGHVYSHDDIDVSRGAALEVQGYGRAFAHGGCAGPISTENGVPPDCDLSTASIVGADPAYAPPAAPASLAQPAVAPCSRANPTATLSPGVYRDAAALDDLTDGSCDAVWLRPGTYFLEFTGDDTWDVRDKDVRIVGGTLTGPLASTSFPGGCDPDGAGVTLVFAGDSRLDVAKGSVELCGAEHPDGVRLALYGLGETVAVGTGSIAPQSACLTTSGESCRVIRTGPGSDADLRVVGVGYLPRNWVDLQPTNESGQFVTKALVVRKLTLHASSATAGNPVVIGDGSTDLGPGDVLLTASIGGVPWIRSHVTYPDGADSDPSVESWVVER
jgi:hypothetical protein